MHCVDLGESFPMHIFLQNLASLQRRTSPVKFARSPCTDRHFSCSLFSIWDPVRIIFHSDQILLLNYYYYRSPRSKGESENGLHVTQRRLRNSINQRATPKSAIFCRPAEKRQWQVAHSKESRIRGKEKERENVNPCTAGNKCNFSFLILLRACC